MRRLFAERNRPLLAALAVNADELLLEVDVTEVEIDRLAAPKAGRVDELDERSVSQRKRPLRLEPSQLRVDLLRARRRWKPPRTSRRQGRIRHAFGPEGEADQRPHRRELARDRCGRQL